MFCRPCNSRWHNHRRVAFIPINLWWQWRLDSLFIGRGGVLENGPSTGQGCCLDRRQRNSPRAYSCTGACTHRCSCALRAQCCLFMPQIHGQIIPPHAWLFNEHLDLQTDSSQGDDARSILEAQQYNRNIGNFFALVGSPQRIVPTKERALSKQCDRIGWTFPSPLRTSRESEC